MAVYTIGFTKKSAAEFFGTLKRVDVKRLLDVRLGNSSQLAGFTKKDDLAYFLQEILGAEYMHEPLLAPTRELLDQYKKQRGSWHDYEIAFLDLMRQRGIERRHRANRGQPFDSYATGLHLRGRDRPEVGPPRAPGPCRPAPGHKPARENWRPVRNWSRGGYWRNAASR